MFKEYYISSLKLEFEPVHIDAGNGNPFIMQSLHSGTTMDAMVSTQIQGALDYRTHDPTKRFKRFYRVKQYARQKQV